METDAGFYGRAIVRVYRWIIALAVVATAGALVWRGWQAGIAFACGAVAAYFSFKWLHEVVDALGPGARPARKRVLVLAGLRYALIGLGAYVIVKIFGMNGLAAVLGLLVPVGAVIAEIIYELANGT